MALDPPPSLGPLLRAEGLSRSYGPVRALVDVGVTLQAGRVRAIVGENGAGKSTLARLLTGLEAPDAGRILWQGRLLGRLDRGAARALGVALVPQHLAFIPTLTAVENHMLMGDARLLRPARARAELATTAARIGLQAVLDQPMERLGLAQRQMAEIVSAVAAGARVLLLDEPTSSLGPREIAALVATLRQLAAAGQAVALVTHRVEEVLEGADDVTVLRAGRLVHEAPVAGLDGDAIAALMVGSRDRSPPAPRPRRSDWARLRLTGVTALRDGRPALEGVTLVVHEGEILGVAGVAGPAQPALAEVAAGLLPAQAGAVLVDGTPVTGDATAAARAGLAFAPEERGLAIVPDLSVAVNASLPHLAQPGFRRWGLLRNRAAEAAAGAAIIARHDVRPPDPAALAGGLSGGNQQKLLIGRELSTEPSVMVVHGPTKGLDLAAAAAIRAALAQAAATGTAVLVISADLDELLGLCHRLVVLSGRRIAAEFDLATPLDMAALARAMADRPTPEAA